MSAALVAAGMLISRLSGYVRVTLFSAVFGLRIEGDIFNLASRIPNFLQNLLGEGALSASLIPVYSALMVTDRARADQVARAVLGVLAFICAVVVLVGVTWTRPLVMAIAPGYHGETLDLTVHLVRVMFPGIGLLVLSAWCLAILNSHHRFFLSYVAPVCWNGALIASLIVYQHADLSRLTLMMAWASVLGAALQLGVQAPVVWRLMAMHWRSSGRGYGDHVRRVLITSVPVVFTRGGVQVSAFVDNMIASFLPPGALSALANVQQLSQLPIALFGMAVSSAALPSMSTAAAANLPDALRGRLIAGQETIVALVVPSMVVFLACGDVMIAMLLEHGKFTHANTLDVWGVLAGSAVGLLATTVGRLYVSTFYALGDTKTPMRIALVRFVVVAALGYVLALPVPRLLGISAFWGTAGLTASAGVAGWIEFALLRRALQQRLGDIATPISRIGKAWLVALLAALPATALRWALPEHAHLLRGLLILGVFGTLYLAGAQLAGILDSTAILRRVLRRR